VTASAAIFFAAQHRGHDFLLQSRAAVPQHGWQGDVVGKQAGHYTAAAAVQQRRHALARQQRAAFVKRGPRLRRGGGAALFKCAPLQGLR
jgi:hypothetical protein